MGLAAVAALVMVLASSAGASATTAHHKAVATSGHAAAVATIANSGFGSYSGTKPLSKIAPGTVLKTRTVDLHVVDIPLPVTVIQLLYRSTGALGQPTTNVTSVIEPPYQLGTTKVVSFESAYDSLNPADEPSAQIYGHGTLGAAIWDAENLFVAPLLLDGVTVVVPDTEGQKADFAAGPVYGMNSLDSIRAATNSKLTGIASTDPVALLGYSGGAIGVDWSAQLAPKYAPAVNRRLVGAAEGGLLVDPAHNLEYVNGSSTWAGIAPMAIDGLARAYRIDMAPYINSYGKQVLAKMQSASIINVLGAYPGLKFAQLVKPRYANPFSIPPFVKTVNQLNLGHQPMPTIPFLIGQGAGGYEEGTPAGGPGIGPGDGVMVTGDVRTLAREFCAAGDAVDYQQYDALSHTSTMVAWAPGAVLWVVNQLNGGTAPNNCSAIPSGNSLALQKLVK